MIDYANAEYAICPDAIPDKYPEAPRTACAAGCGRIVVYRHELPDKLPKVCIPCGNWLSNCEGEA